MNLMELFIKITADTSEVDKSIGDTKKKALSFGDVLKANIAGQAIVAGVKAVAGAVKNIGEAAIQSYAEYEQLVGGAKLMFGDAYDFVAEKAKNAYSTVQMSQNDYLQQVNGFATGLKTALGGNEQAAAELADKIINAEADVVAATGNSQEAVQNAFNGIMKSNYTMLDNLQIGITPTKEGFQEVIDKVNEWNAANGEATNYVIDNLADAQSALVDYIEMQGLQGYAANEAASTIQGSLASMKGAWENLLTGVAADNANFEVLVSSFVDSLVGVGENIIPRINIVIQGLTQLITESSQTIIPIAVETLLQNLPAIVAAGMDLIMALVNGILDNIDLLIDCTLELIDVVVNKLIENLPKLIDGGIRLIIALGIGLIEAIPQLVGKIPEIITAIIEGFASGASRILDIGKNIVEGVWQGIKNAAKWLKDKVFGFFDDIVGGVKDFLGIHSPSKVFAGIGGFMAEGLGEGFDDQFKSVKKDIENSMSFDAGNITADANISKNYAIGSYGAASVSSDFGRIVMLLEQYLPMLANMKVIMDSGQVVGLLAPGMDEELAKINARRARAV